MNEVRNVQQTENTHLKQSGIAYSVGAVLPQIFSIIFSMLFLFIVGQVNGEQDWYLYFSFLMPQICFFLTAFLFFYRAKTPVMQVVGKCKWQYFLIAILLQFGLLSLSWLNGYFLQFLSFLGYQDTSVRLPDLSGWNLLPAILVIAVLPAIFEEVLFRGILVGGTKKGGWGIVACVLLNGALFSLFHTNPAQTLYQFCCGVCFALVAWRSGSVLPTVLSHFLNNTFILIMTSFGYADFPSAVQLPLYLTAGIVLLATLAYLVFFDKRGGNERGMTGGKTFFKYSGVGIAVCAIAWVTVLIGGFAA